MNMAMHKNLFHKVTQGSTSVGKPELGFSPEVLKFWKFSPDSNPREILWRILTHKVYANNRQFLAVKQLIEAFFDKSF